MKNLIDTINIGIIFLDKHLNIRSFTHEAVRIYHLVSSDVGRQLNDIKLVSDFGGEDLIAAAQKVLASLIPHDCELQIGTGEWMMVHMQPYCTLDNFIDGVVISFTDISVRVEAEKESVRLANSIVNTVREPLLVLDARLKIVAVSKSFYTQFQVQPAETLGSMIFELGNHQWNIPALRDLLLEVITKNIDFDDYVVEHNYPAIGHRKMRLNARRIIGEKNLPSLILLSIEVNV